MQITNTVGHVYDIVSSHKNVYRVADPKTGQVVGYIAHATFGHISVNGPLAPTAIRAAALAAECAFNRYRGSFWHKYDTVKTK